jgi:hypothetical protein
MMSIRGALPWHYKQFRKKRHKMLLAGSPCFTPIFEFIKLELVELYITNDLPAEYIDLIANIFCATICIH